MFKMFNLGEALLNKTATCQSDEMDWEWLKFGQLWIESWGMWMQADPFRNSEIKRRQTSVTIHTFWTGQSEESH